MSFNIKVSQDESVYNHKTTKEEEDDDEDSRDDNQQAPRDALPGLDYKQPPPAKQPQPTDEHPQPRAE